ncbi:MAG: hypothetical protein KGQ59_11350 [Bdellovibrionales bacterium]|nr:hypothetical protein [Bdellovibrionales bacterium]
MSSEKSKVRFSLRSVMLLNTVITLLVLFSIFHGVRVLNEREGPGSLAPPQSIENTEADPEWTPPEPPIWLPIFVIAGGLVCVAGSMALVLMHLRSKARGAEQILERLRKGEFSARLSTGMLEELGGLTPKFNEMADEIESLVVRLRSSEKNRIELIQDIGHDLRHPLASIRVLAEMLQDKAQNLTLAQTSEIRELLQRESLAIEDMLEDLLTMASLEDPKLKVESDDVNLFPELEEFIDRFKLVEPSKKFVLQITDETLRGFRLRTDRGLFFRMLRNAVENARRFAQTTVTVRVGRSSDRSELAVDVIDDGAGFSSKALEWFLRRERHTAVPGLSTGRGAGLGLGSFVMRKIADLLQVKLGVDNLKEADRIVGGRLRLSVSLSENKSA